MRHELWSGWGFRTMSTSDAAYSPLSYHNGTVWPHDTALAAWGLGRYGHWDAVHRVASALFEAARHFDWSLPEVFAGFDRRGDALPDRISDRGAPPGLGGGDAPPAPPTSARPRARHGQRAAGTLPGVKPLDHAPLSLQGVRALGRTWDVSSSAAGIGIEAA